MRTKFFAGIIGIVVVLGMAMMIFVRTALHQRLVDVHQKRGLSLARHVADHSLDLVLTERFLQLDLMLRDEKNAEEDVKYIFVLNPHEEVVSHTFSDGFPADLKDINPFQPGHAYDVLHLDTDEGHIIDIAVPLLNGTAGILHVGIAGESIEEGIHSVIQQVIWIMTAILIAGGATAVIFTRAVTRPLLELEEAVHAMGGGDMDQRVRVKTDDEIGQLGAAFNTMAEKRKQAAEDRELLIGELREALDNVKTLSGLIPICASCKKIRDDKGYWSQIEAYISKHSGAEFSHSICPQCAEKLYPNRSDKERKA